MRLSGAVSRDDDDEDEDDEDEDESLLLPR
jgi:hypothetical protein